MTQISFDASALKKFVHENELGEMQAMVNAADSELRNGTGAGADFRDWLHLPTEYDHEEFDRIKKAANPMTVKGKTATIKYSAVRKKTKKLAVSKVLTVQKNQGTVSYGKSKGNGKIKISKTSGKVTVKKGLKKGTYKVTVKVKAAGTKNYKAAAKTVTFQVKVK